MGAITQFLKKDVVFEPHDIKAMSMALDDVCKSLPICSTAIRRAKSSRSA